jgi:hypothetical protein
VAKAWYHDDQCLIAEWQCEVGTLGLLGMVVLGPIAAGSVLVTLIAWGADITKGPGPRADDEPDS